MHDSSYTESYTKRPSFLPNLGGQITSLFPIAISALCPALGAKIFFFRFSEFCALLSPFHSDCRGALRVVTNAERNAVDADVLSDERHRGGRRNRVVLAPQRLARKSQRS